MNYPVKAVTTEILLEVGRLAAAESTARHPEDLAAAIASAVETAAVTLQVVNRRGGLLR